MQVPVSGTVRVSDEIINYHSDEPKRLCLQKTGEGEWEVRFVSEGEESVPSWYDVHNSGLFRRIWNVFSRYIPFTEEPSKVILDVSYFRPDRDRVSVSHGQTYRVDTIAYIIFGLTHTAPFIMDGRAGHNEAVKHEVLATLEYYFLCEGALLSSDVMEALRAGREDIDRVLDEMEMFSDERRMRRLGEALILRPNLGSRAILEVKEEFDALAQDPLGVLTRIREKIATGTAFGRLRVQFLAGGAPQEGIDAGGVRRAFLSALFKALSESKDLGQFVFSEEEHGLLPKLISLEEEVSDETAHALETIGYLLGFCVIDHACRIHPLFDPSFFVALTSLTAEEIRSKDTKAAYLALTKNNSFFEQMKEVADEYCNEDLFVPALLYIATGMLQLLDGLPEDGWERITRMEANELLEKIEGKFSKEILLEKLRVDDPTVDGYLREWIDEADTENLLNFVDAVTGAPSMGPGEIRVGLLADNDTAPARFHTCFNTMEIRGYSSYEEFKEKLEWALANAKGFGDK